MEGFDKGHHKSAHNLHGTYFLSLRALTTKYKYWKQGSDVFEINTISFQDSGPKKCVSFDVEWQKAVLGRLEYAQDLPILEARYNH